MTTVTSLSDAVVGVSGMWPKYFSMPDLT